MAKHKSFNSLSKALKKRANNVETNVGKIIRKAALVADSSVVFATPVDLGRARSSWAASIGIVKESDTGIDEQINSNAAANIALNQAKPIIAKWKPGSGSIFLSNSVIYITFLNDGSSAQAPEGMTAQAILAAQTVLKQAKLLGKN